MSKKRIMVDMSATLIHHGHIRLIQKAAALGHVIIGLTSDAEIKTKKGYQPELNYSQRSEILEAVQGVDEVVQTPWLITEAILDKHSIDLLVHGDDNSNDIDSNRLLIFPRTQDVSSQELRERATRAIYEKLKHEGLANDDAELAVVALLKN